MKRLVATFERLRAHRRKALLAYLTAGDPDLDTSIAAALAASRGADVLEIGVPFSDPVADGPVIQRAMQRALAAGGGLLPALEVVRRVRAQSDVPIVLFGYLNPLLWHGLDAVCRDAKEAGACGLLVVDVPAEEAGPIRQLAGQQELAWVSLVAPTSGEARAREVAKTASGFVYLVSMTGVTGGALQGAEHLAPLVSAVREASGLPVCIGFGIRDAHSAQAAAQVADGVVVGSALVQQLERAASPSEAVRAVSRLVAELRAGVDAAGG